MIVNRIKSLGSQRGVMAKEVDCRFEVSGFDLQSRKYICFWSYNLKKDMKLLIYPLEVSLLFVYKDDFGIK